MGAFRAWLQSSATSQTVHAPGGAVTSQTPGLYMLVNSDKMKALLIDYSRKPSCVPNITIQGKDIERVHATKLLRVTITSGLTWGEHVDVVDMSARQPSGCISWLCWGAQGCRLRVCSGCSQQWWGHSPSMPARHGTRHWQNSSQTSWRAFSNGPWRVSFQIYHTERRCRRLNCPRCVTIVGRSADSSSMQAVLRSDTVSTTFCPGGDAWATAWEITACALHRAPDMRDLSGHWSPTACTIDSDF